MRYRITSSLSFARSTLFVFAVTLAFLFCAVRAGDEKMVEMTKVAYLLEKVWLNTQEVLSIFTSIKKMYDAKSHTGLEFFNFGLDVIEVLNEKRVILKSDQSNLYQFVNELHIEIPQYNEQAYLMWCSSPSATLEKRKILFNIIEKSFSAQSYSISYQNWLQQASNINVLWLIRVIHSSNLLQLQKIFETINEMNFFLSKLNQDINLLEKQWFKLYDSYSHTSSSGLLKFFFDANKYRCDLISKLLLESWQILQILRGILYSKIPQLNVHWLSPLVQKESTTSAESLQRSTALFTVSYQLQQLFAHIQRALRCLTKAPKDFGFLISTITCEECISQTQAIMQRSKFSYDWTNDLEHVETILTTFKMIRLNFMEKNLEKHTFQFLQEFESIDYQEIVLHLKRNLKYFFRQVTAYRANLRNDVSIEKQLKTLGELGSIWSKIRARFYKLVQSWRETYLLQELFFANQLSDVSEAQRLESQDYCLHFILEIFRNMHSIDLALETFQCAVKSAKEIMNELIALEYPYHSLKLSYFTSQKEHVESNSKPFGPHLQN